MAVERLDLARTWKSALAMARANVDAVSAIAGMFILLPGILSAYVLPDPPLPVRGMTIQQLNEANLTYIAAHWPPIVLVLACAAFGVLAVLALLLHSSRPTVAGALRMALTVLPLFLLAGAFAFIVVGGGLTLFFFPGLHLAARFVCIAPVVVVEHVANPLTIIGRSFLLTHGNGWRIVLMIAVILVMSMVLWLLAGLTFGVAAFLLLPADLGRLATIIVASVVKTALIVTLTLVSAALYRHASAARSRHF